MKTTEELRSASIFWRPVYKTDDVCELLGINATTYGLYVKYNLLPSRKNGRKYLLTHDELMSFLDVTKDMEISNTPEGIKAAAAEISCRRGRFA